MTSPLPQLFESSTSLLREQLVRAVPLIGGALALGVGALTARSFVLGLLAASVPLFVLAVLYPGFVAIIAVSVIPFAESLTGASGVQIAATDLLLLAALGCAVLHLLADPTLASRLRSTGPLVALGGLYLLVAVVILPFHLDSASILNTVQRFQLLVVPVVVGAMLVTGRYRTLALGGYVLAATGLAAAWPFVAEGGNGLGIQKNPAGQFIANGIILLLVRREFRWLRILLPVLSIGLIYTQSRGALIGLGAAVIVIVLLDQGHRGRSALQLIVLLLGIGVALVLLPSNITSRTTDFNGGGAYAADARIAYRSDALAIISQHLVTGVGVGNYLSGDVHKGTETNDPHNILLLTAAEGGLPMLAGFLLLTLGTLIYVIRRRSDWTLAAVTVQSAILVHACVDVYWVRGTPTLGWILIGVAFASPRSKPAVAEAA